MSWYFNLYSLILFFCSILTVWVALYAWRRRAWIGHGPVLLLVGIAIWTAGYAVALGVHEPEWRIFWAKVQHIGIALAPIALAVFVLRYAGYEKWLTRRNVVLLSAIPVVGLLLTWTNDHHGLIWAETQVKVIGSLSLLDRTYGPYFWLYFIFNYLVLLVSAAVFLRASFQGRFLHRRQAVLMLAGSLCVAAALVIDLGGLSPFPYLDLVPLGFSVGVLVIAWGVFRHHLLDIVPVARATLVENMSDVLVVMDLQDRVVDMNLAVQEITSITPSEALGGHIGQVFPFWGDVQNAFQKTGQTQAEIALMVGGSERCYDLKLTGILDRNQEPIGNMLVLRDITERKQAEIELQNAKAAAEEQREKAQALLLNILPEQIAILLEDEIRIIADQYEQVSILFADVVDFTPFSAGLTPLELVEMLNEIFSHIDSLVEKYGLEKIKTIGDCYMAAAGVPRPRADHAKILAQLAVDIRCYINSSIFHGRGIAVRIGINSGPVVAGVIGSKKFAYDLWGDAVNIASRMESSGSAGLIQVTQSTYELIKDDYNCAALGAVHVKGKGDIQVWNIVGKLDVFDQVE